MRLVAGWAARTVAAVAVVLVAGQLPALAAPPVGGGGGDGGGGGGGGTPPACLTNATASLHVSAASVFAGQGVVVSWSSWAASGCTVGRTVTGPGFDPTEALPVSGSRQVATPTVGTMSWSLTLWSGSWSLPNSARTSVTVAALPQSPGVAAVTQNDGRLDVFESSYVAPQDQTTFAQQRTPADGFDATDLGVQLRSVVAGVNGYWNIGQVQWFGLDPTGQVYTGMQAAPGGPGWLTAGLFDADGRPGLTSLAVANNNDGRLQVFGTDWFGNVVTRWQLRTGGWSGWGQFDGNVRRMAAARQADGRIVLLGVNVDGNVYEKVQGAPDGAWPAGWTLLQVTGTSVAVTADAEGRLEMFVADTTGTIQRLVQDAPNATTWTPAGSVVGVGDQIAVATNADGRIEIISHDVNGALVHRAQTAPGAATWTDWVPLEQAAPAGPVICAGFATCTRGDVDGDGRPDAIGFVQSARTGTAQDDVWVALADRFHPGSYHPAQRWSDQFCPAPMTCATGDLHADGRLDLVAFDHSNGDVWVSRLNADGTAYLAPERWTGPNTCHGNEVCGVADIDGDGLADVLARDPADTTLGTTQTWASPNTGSGFGPRILVEFATDGSLPRSRPPAPSCAALRIAAASYAESALYWWFVASRIENPTINAILTNLAENLQAKAEALDAAITAGRCTP